jgi:two-component system C4-dicarboxylate transport response regulator DctD
MMSKPLTVPVPVQGRIIFVDDEMHIRRAGEQALKMAGFEVHCFESAESAQQLLAEDWPGVLITDVKLPGASGLELMHRALSIDRDLPVVLITGHGDISMAVQAIHDGAYDFIEKPFGADRLVEVAKRSIEKRLLILENRALRNELREQLSQFNIIGNSPQMALVRKQVAKIADVDADVLIYGETGTGKELIAHTLHKQSRRRDKPFVAVNCGAMPEHIIENELFGHEPGAFTGANSRQIGKFEYAHKGTIFLDEIESMPQALSVKLLRVLQERTIERLGSSKTIPVDVRVIAATKADLREASTRGEFREDLYYRLAVVQLNLPALRERRDDIQILFQYFLDSAARRYDCSPPAPGPEVTAELMAHDWPGNVRELQNTADRYVLGCFNDLSSLTNLSQNPNNGSPVTLAEMVSCYERRMIEQQLAQHKGDARAAYTALGLPRKTFEDKLRKYELNRKDYQ